MSARRLTHEGGIFASLHRSLVGDPIDSSDLDLARRSEAHIELARRVWQHRVRTEFRSVQIMVRFVTEVVGAGDPLEVYAGAIDLVNDEVRHVSLCAQLCEALGAPALLPDPVELQDPPAFVAAPMAHRALTTAIQMLAINETLSVALIEDLRARCTDPAVKRVLDATVEDEEGHQALGWRYVEISLARFPSSTLDDWRHLVRTTLEPHRASAQRALAEVASEEHDLTRHPEPELAALGLASPVRQALVYRRCFDEQLAPKLRSLSLL